MKIEQRSKRIVQYSYSSYYCAFTCTVYKDTAKTGPAKKVQNKLKHPSIAAPHLLQLTTLILLIS